MSYILDALKRAEAERERGAVPGVHARQVSVPVVDATPAARSRVVWVAALALVLLGIAAGWWAARKPADDPRRVTVDVVAAVAPVLAPVAPTLGAQLAHAPKLNAVAPAAVPRAAALPVAALAPLAVAPVVQASEPEAAAAAVPLLSDLPEDLRRLIPVLTINGVVYSDNPAQRLLVVNNQVLTHGSVAAPDVNLDEIQPKSSVFVFRGTRFRVAH